MVNNISKDATLQPVKDEHESELVNTVYHYVRLINKKTDQNFATPEFLLHNTILSCLIMISWFDNEALFTLIISKDEEKSFRIRPSFQDVIIFHDANKISNDFKVESLNDMHGSCYTINHIDFYNYFNITFEFHIKHMIDMHEPVVPTKFELYTRLNLMYEEKKFTDLKIYVKNTEFLAHKAIVGRYPNLVEMFEDSKEGNNVKIINIKDMDPAIFEVILKYLYVGKTDTIVFHKDKLTFLFDLLQAADKYKIDDLKNKLIELMILHMNKDNVIEMLEFADRCDLNFLKNRCVYYITVYRSQFCENLLFKQMIFNNPTITADMLYLLLESCSL